LSTAYNSWIQSDAEFLAFFNSRHRNHLISS